MKKIVLSVLLCCTCCVSYSQSWPAPRPEAKAGTRWWWLGSAVNHSDLEWNLNQYARVGIGTVEITPIYGVQGNEKNEIPFLSPQWMQVLNDVQNIAGKIGIEVDMNCGTGWPFGGPAVQLSDAACKAVFKENHGDGLSYSVEIGRTGQKVKRAAPGGEGLVIDHFDAMAVRKYLERFDSAFVNSAIPWPHTFFNDSYEAYGANWTPSLFSEFRKRRGYDLSQHLPELLGREVPGGMQPSEVLADYRETMSDLLIENFTRQWADWAHSHGVMVRNQAHGSPANLLDVYAAVDIPEIEGFGLSEFGIKGLRKDPGMSNKNFSDVSMLKYASSAAHVMGKPFTSSETFTWLTEHFRTSLSQMKPDLDLMFTCGVNRVFFHGTCYSPKDEPWPGWKFYASIDMSPTNSIWRDAPYLMDYIERCQSFLQLGTPDNDFLVYLPVRDMWRKRIPNKDGLPAKPGEDLLMLFDIHTMAEKAPEFIRSILKIDSLGYDCDYISDRQLENVTIDGQWLVSKGGTRYRAIIIPEGTTIDQKFATLLKPLAQFVIYGEDEQEMAGRAMSEPMRTQLKLRAIRRVTPAGSAALGGSGLPGHHYFIANLTPNDVNQATKLAVPCVSATWFNPMTGDIIPATVSEGKVLVNLRSGESRILVVSSEPATAVSAAKPPHAALPTVYPISTPWKLSFTEEAPVVHGKFDMDSLQTWETFSPEAAVTMGTGVYTTTFSLPSWLAERKWIIDLGDVRESARVYLNGKFLGCAWAVPFVLDCRDALRSGDNKLRIEVTNLPANRIADLDRRGVKWRKMKDINVVDINYKNTNYSHWAPVASGLNSRVKLVEK